MRFWTATALCGALLGCAPAHAPSAASPSAEREAEREVRTLSSVYAGSSPRERRELVPSMRRFIEIYPDFWGTDAVRLLLGGALLADGETKEPEALAKAVLAHPSSPSHDDAWLLLAEIALHQRSGNEARAILVRLDGRLLTRDRVLRHLKGSAAAALLLERYGEMMVALGRWAQAVGQQNQEVRQWTQVALGEMSIPAQRALFLDWEKLAWHASVRPNVREELYRALLDRLVIASLENEDVGLAQALLRAAPSWLRASERGDALAMLGALRIDDAKQVLPVVGLALGGSTDSATRRSIEVATGVMAAVGAADGTRVLAEDIRGSLETALLSLVEQGAALIIAGVDEESSVVALDFAEAREIPVLALTDPGFARSEATLRWHKFGFVFGISAAAERAALSSSLAARGFPDWEWIGSEESPCADTLDALPETTYPLSAWQAAGRGVVLLSGAQCSRSLLEQNRQLRSPVRLAFTLETAYMRTAPSFFVQAGSYPPRAVACAEACPRVPGWYEALGMDAGRLSAATIRKVGELKTPFSRALVQATLGQVEVQLTTTSAPGFQGSHFLSRALTIGEELPATRKQP